MAVLTVRSPKEDLADFSINTLYKRLLQVLPQQVFISEPMPAPIAKAYGQFRYQCTLKSQSARAIADAVSREIRQLYAGEDVIFTLDIDAYSFM